MNTCKYKKACGVTDQLCIFYTKILDARWEAVFYYFSDYFAK